MPARISIQLAWLPLVWLATPPTGAGQEPSGTPAQVRSLPAADAVSEPFRALALAAVQSVPEPVWTLVERAGWQVQLAVFVVDVQPELAADQPRGWPTTSSWLQADAIHFPAERLLVLAEKRRNAAGQVVECTRIDGVLRHELGHAFDMATGGGRRFRSASAEFQAAYQADLYQLPADLGGELAYYLQPSNAGRQEAFAEAFGIVLGGGSDVTKELLFRRSFPAVLAFVQRDVDRTAATTRGAEGEVSDKVAIPGEPSRWVRLGRTSPGHRGLLPRGAMQRGASSAVRPGPAE